MAKIAVIGDRDSVLGFRALGLEVHTVEDSTEAHHLLRKAAEEGCAAVFLTEALAAPLQEEIDRLASCNRCERVDARMLLIDMVSLNVFLFLAAPIVKTVAGSIYGDYDLFLEMRKRENVKTILGKLKLEL